MSPLVATSPVDFLWFQNSFGVHSTRFSISATRSIEWITRFIPFEFPSSMRIYVSGCCFCCYCLYFLIQSDHQSRVSNSRLINFMYQDILLQVSNINVLSRRIIIVAASLHMRSIKRWDDTPRYKFTIGKTDEHLSSDMSVLCIMHDDESNYRDMPFAISCVTDISNACNLNSLFFTFNRSVRFAYGIHTRSLHYRLQPHGTMTIMPTLLTISAMCLSWIHYRSRNCIFIAWIFMETLVP